MHAHKATLKLMIIRNLCQAAGASSQGTAQLMVDASVAALVGLQRLDTTQLDVKALNLV